MKRAIHLIAASALVCGALPAQEQEEPRLDPAGASLLDAARAVQPEYTVDIIRRLLASQYVESPKLRRELIEEAFELASRVRHPYPISSIHPHTDSLSGKLSQSLATGLDRLTIQTRLTYVMTNLDADLGREMFARIPRPRFPVHGCEDTALPNPNAYFSTAAFLVTRAFSVGEVEEGVDQQFLVAILQGIHSTLELAPAAEMILNSAAKGDDLTQLIEEYALAVGRLQDGDREAAVALERRSVGSLWGRLGEKAQRNGAPLTPLIGALRSFLVRRLTGSRCSDTVEAKRVDKGYEIAVEALSQFTAPDGRPLFAPLTEAEREPSEVLEAGDVHHFWQTEKSKALLAEAKWLRFGGTSEYLTAEEKEGADWQLRGFDFLMQISDWRPAMGEPAMEHFHIKAGLFENMVDLAPNEDLRRRAIRSNLSFMATNQMQADDPAQFLWQLNRLLNLARELTGARGRTIQARLDAGVRIPGLPNGSRDLILEEMRSSSNAVLALFARAEELLPRGFGDESWP